ncbi:pyruvate dehydrogenase kinase Pkp1 [Schizosaccharomyces octosporus yFS286]|uniref:Protein-serine/threonine kinase n=1 Tax=Schizosaccharomyces octosporus (strain yFS286) TaxID=483514 RepID=S9PY22_SCHOY|nr:pyruvate dehydrogenase kinase Pkp1 [Schizosaccharomyces octosporus yFS286]EPX72867.1 pyruvate dehydrogenase kinase Pkp1 [Schizosaccharomyces octosporus yFS286]
MSVVGKSLQEKVNLLAQYPQTGLSLKQLVYFGQDRNPGRLFRSGLFLRDELPIRLAHRIQDLQNLPPLLGGMKRISAVRAAYARSMEEIIDLKGIELPKCLPKHKRYPKAPKWRASFFHNFVQHNPSLLDTHLDSSRGRYFNIDFSKPCTGEEYEWPESLHKFNISFSRLLDTIRTRHDNVASELALDIQEYRRKTKQIDHSIQVFLDRFYMSRIGIRMLIGQYIALVTEPPRENRVGIISTQANILRIIEDATESAKFICRLSYCLFEAPPVEIICDPSLHMMYAESHLNHAIFEILKNSLRATVEYYGVDADSYPPVKVLVVKGEEDITIRISDRGGGFTRKDSSVVWSYMYTTAHETLSDDYNDTMTAASSLPPMAGFGFGLPLARLYTRYFGGDLKLVSMEGYGTDAYIQLNRLCESAEPLQ